MSQRYDAEWTASLLKSDRFGSVGPEELLSQSGLSSGMTAVDYGCGPGFFTLPAAGIVGPEGLVYAVDIEPKMVALIGDRVGQAGHHNVRAVLNEAGAAPLPDGLADFAVCALVMHYPEDRDGRLAITRDLGRLVAPGGHVLLVQRGPRPGEGASGGISSEEATTLMADAGFDNDEPRRLAEGLYTFIATKLP